MVYSEKRNKRFGYVFSTKRKNRQCTTPRVNLKLWSLGDNDVLM